MLVGDSFTKHSVVVVSTKAGLAFILVSSCNWGSGIPFIKNFPANKSIY